MDECLICRKPLAKVAGAPGRAPTVCQGSSTYVGRRRRRVRTLSDCEIERNRRTHLKRVLTSVTADDVQPEERAEVARSMNAARMRINRVR